MADSPVTTLFPAASGALGNLPVAAAAGARMALLQGGETRRLEPAEALMALAETPHLVCHAHYLIARLAGAAETARPLARAAREQKHLDIAELFAFAAPAVAATPTPRGLARALGLAVALPECETVRAVAQALVDRLASPGYPHPREAIEVAQFLARTNWPWAGAVRAALQKGSPRSDPPAFATGLNVWDRLAEWEEEAPKTPTSHHPVQAAEAQTYLGRLTGPEAERRPQQMRYCADAVVAFAPRETPTENHILLAEAGTGLGKTLGYLAPAHLWAKRNGGPVWVSTYTRNLQRQLEQETARLVPDPAERRERIVVRKGRENYLCLLNMQEAFQRLTAQSARNALLAGLIARWARHTRDGDMVGGDFPAWLLSLLLETDPGEAGQAISPQSLGLTDRRGECIYAACPHYRKCFLEKAVRASKKAEIVIANHALVLHQAAVDQALGPAQATGDQETPGALRRIVFDEGHHLFDAADSAFSGHLTGGETAELRRWIRGPEAVGRRGRGLAERVRELIDGDETAERHLQAVLSASLALPGPGWLRRIQSGNPMGPAELFLSFVRQQVLARAENENGPSLETDCRPFVGGLAEAAQALADALLEIRRPMAALAQALARKLDAEAAELPSQDRARIEAVSRSLRRRGELMVGGWTAMIGRLLEAADPTFVDWFSLDQIFGRETDCGLHCHWVDPTEPLANVVLRPADGVLVTSATLRDRPPQAPEDWRHAEMRTGAVHLPYPVSRTSYESPFDYIANARILVVNDLDREDMDQLAAAYRELFLAAGGGALGLFTAIARLRAVHRRILRPLSRAGLPLFAQHVDPIDTGTLVDMFRAERHACLVGTDAVRDGVDVPGDSLRLIVLDRVPWGQPTILERARRKAFGGAQWQDMIVRLRLRQAFGRLIRRADDRGAFVVLDSRLASRFTTAFPPDLPVVRCGLVEAIDTVRDFCAPLATPAASL